MKKSLYTYFKTLEEFKNHFDGCTEITDIDTIQSLMRFDRPTGAFDVSYTFNDVTHYFSKFDISTTPSHYEAKVKWGFGSYIVQNPDFKAEHTVYMSAELWVYFVYDPEFPYEIENDIYAEARKALLGEK